MIYITAANAKKAPQANRLTYAAYIRELSLLSRLPTLKTLGEIQQKNTAFILETYLPRFGFWRQRRQKNKKNEFHKVFSVSITKMYVGEAKYLSCKVKHSDR